MRRRIGHLAVMAGLALPAGVSAAEGPQMPLEDLLQRVQARYADSTGVQARFEQHQEVRPGAAPTLGTGRIFMQSPGRLRMEYETTERVLVADGQTLYWFLPDDRQVHVRSQDDLSQRGNALFYLSGQGDMLADFHVEGVEWRTRLRPDSIQMQLEPRLEGADYSSLLLEVDPETAIVLRLVSFGVFGEATEWRFSEIETDADLAEDLFQFTIPAGVSVETLGD